MLDNSHLCTPPDAVIASTLRIGARWKNIFQSDKKYRHEVPSLRVGWLKHITISDADMERICFQYPLFGSVG